MNGRVGPLTRAKLQEVFGNMTVSTTPAATPPSTVSAGVSGGSASTFVKDLTLGNRNEDVRRLQQLLATDPEIYPEGIVSGNFGGLTQRAIRRFQEKYGIKPVNGRVGPLTRAKLDEVFNNIPGELPGPAPVPATPKSSEEQALKDQIAQTIKEIERLRAAATSTATTISSMMATSTATSTATTTAAQ